MVPKEWALILTSVARVMETMSSWERSWVGVPVRWGSCRGGGDAAEEEEEQERQRHQNRHQHNRRESSTPCRERGREREGRKKGAIGRRRAAVTYSRGEPLHQAAYQARIAVHCAVTRAGLDRRLLMIVLLCRFAVVSGFPFPVSISVSVSVRSSAAAAGAARRTLGFFFFCFSLSPEAACTEKPVLRQTLEAVVLVPVLVLMLVLQEEVVLHSGGCGDGTALACFGRPA